MSDARYGNFVGRVGSLAVALGVGIGLAATSAAIASAAPSDAGSSAADTAGSGAGKAPRGGAKGHRSGSETGSSPSRAAGSAGASPAAAQRAQRDAGSPSTRVSDSPVPKAEAVESVGQPTAADGPSPAATVVPAAAVPTSAAPVGAPAPSASTALTSVPRALASTRVAQVAAAVADAIHGFFAPTSAPATPHPGTPTLGLLSFLGVAARREQASASEVAVSADQSPNLLMNPGGEFGNPSLTGYSSVTVPGWLLTGTPTVVPYGTTRRFPSALEIQGPVIPFASFPVYGNDTLKTPANSGKQFFGGGPVADSSMTQTVDLTGALAKIDQGGVTYNLGASMGGLFLDPSYTEVQVNFLDANGASLGTGSLETVKMWDRKFRTGFVQRNSTGTIPVGTRSAQVVVTFNDRNPMLGNYNNAYADNVSLTIGADLPAPGDPAPPVSTVGQLDHVFLVYMENKGYTNIVGSPNAPVINTYFNTYGSANQMYAITHPSTPNYSAVVGGSDFNINYDCDENCVDAPNLSNTFADAGRSWAAYEQNGGGYTNAGELGFLTFSNIYNNADLVNSHILPLTQMATDLEDPATTPNFAWWAADEDNNMEGPVDTLKGILSFAISQVTNQQYNVKAGDDFISQTIPTIMSSNTWLDPTQKSVIFLTFDEDNNNLSLGFDNQGNHIVFIAIPSPGAVAAGMKSGNFQVSTRYDHYSLMRTIEESLGVAPLTQNDRYAVPMNDFWT
jgi:hypothetical protein